MYQQLFRVEQADQLLSQGWTLDSAARGIGLSDACMISTAAQAIAMVREGTFTETCPRTAASELNVV